MGIQDRDYYREDSRWRNPFARSQATIALVIAYAVLYVAQIASRDEAPQRNPPAVGQMTETLQLDPNKVLQGEVWRVASYALVHDPVNFYHVIFTCVFLVWIGHGVEDLYGWKEYLGFFVLTTILGGAVYVGIAAITADTPILLGPSGAVTAILVLFALHFPGRSISLFFVSVPVWLLVGVYALTDVAGVLHRGVNPAAVSVHIAGAGFAFVYHAYTLRVLNWLPSGGEGRSVRRMPTPRLRVTREQPQPEPAATAAAGGSSRPTGGLVDEHLEAKLDEVLAKVTKHGKESLTEGERGVLLRASEIYKRRRQSN